MSKREVVMMNATTSDIAVASRLGLDPAALVTKRLGENRIARPQSEQAEIHARLGIDEDKPTEVDAARLVHAFRYLAPHAARQMASWMKPDHHVAAAVEGLKSFKTGDVNRLAEAASHLIAGLAKCGVMADLDDDGGDPPLPDEHPHLDEADE